MDSGSSNCQLVVCFDYISDSDCLQDLFYTALRATWHNLRPDLVFNAFVRIQYTPIRAVFCLEPLEVINLVVQVLDVFVLLRSLTSVVSKHIPQTRVTRRSGSRLT